MRQHWNKLSQRTESVRKTARLERTEAPSPADVCLQDLGQHAAHWTSLSFAIEVCAKVADQTIKCTALSLIPNALHTIYRTMLRSSIIAGRSASKGCWNLDAEQQRDTSDVRPSSFSTPGALPVSSNVLPSTIKQIIHVRRRLSNLRSCRSSSSSTFESRFRPSSNASLLATLE